MLKKLPFIVLLFFAFVAKAQDRPIKIIDEQKANRLPQYEYELVVNDSLSRRALKRPFELIKIEAKRPILIYRTEKCTTCDTLIANLEKSIYLFKNEKLSDTPKMKDYLTKSLANSATPLESLTTPIVNLGGKIFVDIETYEQLMDKLKEIE